MKRFLEKTDFLSLRFLRFSAVGAANTLVDFLTYSLGLWVGFSPYFSRILSNIVSCLFSFFVNKTWTFNASDKGVMPLIRFAAVNGSTLALGLFLLFVFKSSGFGNKAAYLLTIPFTMASNYLGYRLWAFREVGGRPKLAAPANDIRR